MKLQGPRGTGALGSQALRAVVSGPEQADPGAAGTTKGKGKKKAEASGQRADSDSQTELRTFGRTNRRQALEMPVAPQPSRDGVQAEQGSSGRRGVGRANRGGVGRDPEVRVRSGSKELMARVVTGIETARVFLQEGLGRLGAKRKV
ncbi:MAG: hypothetical protein VKO64_02460 [Candidatus Sericytochromatia bacterium]|nr:hypothetical protein [Candidatus Sericytochromatia bacterium]